MTTSTQTKKPAFIAKSREINGKHVTYERIGVAFENDDGSLFVKLSGTQVVSGFMLYRIETNEPQEA
jgi:hypothetical protein